MKANWAPFLLILLSYPLATLFSVLVSLLEFGLSHFLVDTVWIELYPVFSRPTSTILFFISLNLIAVLWFLHKRKA